MAGACCLLLFVARELTKSKEEHRHLEIAIWQIGFGIYDLHLRYFKLPALTLKISTPACNKAQAHSYVVHSAPTSTHEETQTHAKMTMQPQISHKHNDHGHTTKLKAKSKTTVGRERERTLHTRTFLFCIYILNNWHNMSQTHLQHTHKHAHKRKDKNTMMGTWHVFMLKGGLATSLGSCLF